MGGPDTKTRTFLRHADKPLAWLSRMPVAVETKGTDIRASCQALAAANSVQPDERQVQPVVPV